MQAIDHVFASFVSLSMSVIIGIGCLLAGAWGPAFDVFSVSTFSFYRWTAYAKDVLWSTAVAGATSTVSFAAVSGSAGFAVLGVVLSIAAMVYGAATGDSSER